MEDRFKFRFWHEDTKCMYEDTGLTSLGVNDAIEQADNCCYNIMQCTGLKDENGKLIYEGDIVRSDEYPFNSDSDDNYYAEICFDNETASFFYYTMRNPKLNKVRGASTGNTGILDEHIFKIIGNIYEHKDLLNA